MIRSILGQFLMEKQAKVLSVKKVGWMSDAVLKNVHHDRPMVTFKHPAVFKINKQNRGVLTGLRADMLF